MPTYSHHALADFGARLLVAAGMRQDDAELVAGLLVNADLSGYPAHGIAHLPGYLDRIKEGIVDATGTPEITREGPAFALIDGHFAFGQVVAHRAMRIAIEKARGSGIAVVGIAHSGHVGRLADYVEMAAMEGFIGIGMVSVSSSTIPAYGGMSGVAGTNPMAYGIPGKDGRHFVLDLATSALSRGELTRRRAVGEPIPQGVLLDAEGNPTTEYPERGNRSILLPFGGYKGSGLHLVAEMFGGILSGHGLGREWSPKAPGGAINGAVFQAIDPTIFRPFNDFQDDVDDFLSFVRQGRPRPGFDGVLVPGDRGRAQREKREAEGIALDAHEWPRLVRAAVELGVPLPPARDGTAEAPNATIRQS